MKFLNNNEKHLKLKISRKTIIFILFIILISSVYANYAVSTPGKVTVEQGKEATFDFQIQGYHSEEDLVCEVEIPENKFDIRIEQPITVNKGSLKLVEGKIKAPKTIGEYSYDFCVSCQPKEKTGGTSTNINFCGINLQIEVIPSTKEFLSPLKTIGFIIIILIIISFFLKKILRNNKKPGIKRKKQKIYKH